MTLADGDGDRRRCLYWRLVGGGAGAGGVPRRRGTPAATDLGGPVRARRWGPSASRMARSEIPACPPTAAAWSWNVWCRATPTSGSLDGARTSRLTFDPAADIVPLWSPDGTRIVFTSARSGARGSLPEAHERRGRGGAPRRLRPAAAGAQQLVPGRALSAVHKQRPADERRPLGGADGRRPHAVGVSEDPVSRGVRVRSRRTAGGWPTSRTNRGGTKSTCGRSSARPASADSPSAGAPATTVGGQWQVSTAGGIMPVWRPDGKELYYLNPAGADDGGADHR